MQGRGPTYALVLYDEGTCLVDSLGWVEVGPFWLSLILSVDLVIMTLVGVNECPMGKVELETHALPHD